MLASGCASFSGSSTVPVPVTIGEPRIAGSDTEYVLRGPGYELISPTRDVLPDAREALAGAAREFRRYFAADPGSVTVRLAPATGRGGVTASTAPPTSASELVVPIASLPKGRSRQGPAVVPIGLTQVVARAWVERYVRDRGRSDSMTATGEHASGSTPDSALPDWLEVALPELVSASPGEDLLIARLARQSDLTPLRELFAMQRPAPPTFARGNTGREGGTGDQGSTGGSGGEGSGADGGGPGGAGGTIPLGRERRGGRLGDGFGRGRFGEGSMMRGAKLPPWLAFQVEGLAVTRFLAEREGPGFIGHLVDRVSRGASVEEALQDARVLPHTIDELETAWQAWLRDQVATAPTGSRFSGRRDNRRP